MSGNTGDVRPRGDMLAIPTEYAGTKMRSRLEANIAAQLDIFGVRWKYEARSFLLGTGHFWLDFELPDLHTWIECRGYDGRDEQLDAWAARCVREHDRFVVVRGDGQAQIVGGWGHFADAALRVCEDCRTWFFDTQDETHECSKCGHINADEAMNFALPVRSAAGKVTIGGSYPVVAMLVAMATHDDAALRSLVKEPNRDAWLARTFREQWARRGEPFDLESAFDWFDACNDARRDGRPTPPMPVHLQRQMER